MSRTITVHYDGKPCYEITLQREFHGLLGQIQSLGYKSEQKVCIVTDSNVANLYLNEVQTLLSSYFHIVISHVFEAGEEYKNVATIETIYETLINAKFDRKDILIALGGGVTGDMCGFAAATYLRGIDFIQVPTTLLSQVDSSIGGKTGVDFKQYKNMVGAFYMPRLVYMNLNTLHTLTEEHFTAGIGEILKHGLIKDNAYYQWMIKHKDEILSKNMEVLEEMIYRSCQIKRAVVENDPKEKGERALLNFGHTIGHAIEKLSDFQLIHGDCVAIGVAAASYLSARKGHISDEDRDSICESLKAFRLPVKTAIDEPQMVVATTKLDKKMESGKVKFILLKHPGEAFIDKSISDEELLDAVRFISN